MEMRRDQGTNKSDKAGESISTSSTSTSTSKTTVTTEQNSTTQIKEGRSFTCKTCNKEFSTFQALGGHRTSHNIKPKITSELRERSPKSKTHICPICGAEFTLGQSLGGHMRMHRTLLDTLRRQYSLEEKGDVPVFKKSSSIENKRIALSFDLNLTPEELYIKSRLTMSTTPSVLDSSI